MKKIGLMGGTFDPIHHGHLVAAEEARYALDLERVIFIPAGQPWQKREGDVTSSVKRFEMTKLAIDANPAFELSRIEVDREGPTYTIDTLRAIRSDVGEAELYFITGADATREILTWKDPDEALGLATFVAVSRPGHDLAELDELRARIVVLEIPALAISSTDIRRRVSEGRPIRYLVPDEVAGYISDQGLYKT